MKSVELREAIETAEKYLNDQVRDRVVFEKDRFVVESKLTRDCGNYWLLFYQTDRYVRTQDIRDGLVGNLPIKVSKVEGQVLGFAARGEF